MCVLTIMGKQAAIMLCVIHVFRIMQRLYAGCMPQIIQ